MIRHFKHKGLQLFFETGDKSGIRPDHAARLARQLRQLKIDTLTRRRMRIDRGGSSGHYRPCELHSSVAIQQIS